MRWPWTRKKAEKVNLDADTYSRWLRAHRPPWEWFLRQDDRMQEVLALRGDEHSKDLILALGFAINPQAAELAEAGIDVVEGDPQAAADAEDALLNGLLETAVAKMNRQAAPAAKAGPLTLAGVGERMGQADRDRLAQRRASRTFMGRKPSGGA